MKNHTYIHAILGAALLSTLTACPGNGGDTDTDATATATMSTTNPMTDGTGTDGTSSVGPTTDNPTTDTPTTDNTTATTPGTTIDVDPTSGTTGGDNGFIFPDDPYDAYTQIDRHGAVEAGTAGIRASEGLGFNPGSDITIRDAYNASNPVEDDAGMWVPEIGMSVTFFHDALDDDLMGLMLTPASVMLAVDQAGPVIIPDTIKYDPTMPTGYPNGRNLADPVVDITLAAVLLDLGDHPLTAFADLPLNPPLNDVPFLPDFPFLAPPHLP